MAVNTNLQQAIQMAFYTAGVLLIVGIFLWFFTTHILKNKVYSYRFLICTAIFLSAHTVVTSMLWLYYFNIVLAVPAYFLLLFICYRLHVLHRGGLGIRLAIGCSIATLIFSLFGAWFFGILSF